MTRKQIRSVTPLSITTLDNPVYTVLHDQERQLRNTSGVVGVQHLHKGDKLRLLGCQLDTQRLNPFRIGDTKYILLPFDAVQLTDLGGNPGTMAPGDYEELAHAAL